MYEFFRLAPLKLTKSNLQSVFRIMKQNMSILYYLMNVSAR